MLTITLALFLGFSLSHAQSEEAPVFNPDRVYRDDALYLPSGGSGGVQSQLNQNMGLHFPSNSALPSLPQRPSAERNPFYRAAPPGQTSGLSGQEIAGNGSNVSSASTSPQNQEQNQGNQQSNQAFDQSSSQGSGIASNPGYNGGTNTTNSNGSRVVNGMIYNDDDGPETVKAPEIQRSALTHSLSQNPTSAVNLNRENNGSSRSGNGGALASTSGSSPFGQFQSGGGNSASANNNPPQAGDGLMDRLKNIASGLGEKFFGLGGGGSASARNNRALTSGPGANKNLNGPASAQSADYKGLLQRQLNQYRSIASDLEFSSSQTNIFGHLCKHYKVYAQRHQIPNLDHNCPK